MPLEIHKNESFNSGNLNHINYLSKNFEIQKDSNPTPSISSTLPIAPTENKIADVSSIIKKNLEKLDRNVQTGNKALVEELIRKSMEEGKKSIQDICHTLKQAESTAKDHLFQTLGYLSPWTSKENNPKLIELIKNGDAKTFVELTLDKKVLLKDDEVSFINLLGDCNLYTQDPKTKKTLLHHAVEQGCEEIVLFLLAARQFDSKLNDWDSYLKLKDAQGNTAEDLAEQKGLTTIQRFFCELQNTKFSEESQKIFARLLTERPDFELQQQTLHLIKTLAKRGYPGNNPLLIRAIANSDYQAFIRSYMDGARISFEGDPITGDTLLHLAVQAGLKEIILFLVNLGVDFEIKNAEGLTARNLAEKMKRKDLLDLLPIENSEAALQQLMEKYEETTMTVSKYMETYEKMQSGYSETEKTHRKNIAYHGSEGHNYHLLSCIQNGDLPKFMQWVELGANLHTESLSAQLILEDPTGKWARLKKQHLLKKIQEPKSVLARMQNSLAAMNETFFSKQMENPGKSLLDMAVIFSKEGQENFDLIAYLLSKGLDPFKLNDEGESPFTMALIKGDLKTASLMSHYKSYSENKNLACDEKSLKQIYDLLAEGATLRDPLHVSTTQTMATAFAALYMLSNRLLSPGKILNFVQFLPLILPGFISGNSFREQLNRKSEPQFLQWMIARIMVPLSKASILEIAVLPGTPLATLASTALSTYTSVCSVFSCLKAAAGHALTRPFPALYKVGMSTLPAVNNMLRCKALVSGIFFPIQKDINCKSIDFTGKEFDNIAARARHADINPECREHAKMILARNWSYLDAFLDYEKYVKKLYKQIAAAYHPDHQKNAEVFEKILAAKITLLPKGYKSPTLSSILSSPIALETASKAGIIGALSLKAINYVPGSSLLTTPYFWPVLTYGSLAYRMIKG